MRRILEGTLSSIGGGGGDGSRSSNSNSSNQEQAQEQIRQKDNATIDQLMLGKIGHEVLHDLKVRSQLVVNSDILVHTTQQNKLPLHTIVLFSKPIDPQLY